MHFNKIIGTSVGADYADSKNKSDFEIGPSTVTLSRSEGSHPLATRCFAAAQHDKAVILTIISLIL